jgi:hypothetical protein
VDGPGTPKLPRRDQSSVVPWGKNHMDEQKAKQIAALNDLFRLNFFIPSFGPGPFSATLSTRAESPPYHRKGPPPRSLARA